MTIKIKPLLAAALALAALHTSAAPSAKISVEVGQPAHKIAPTLWGIFFEDINLSADGGIYPELVQNRSFEDAETPESWKFTSTDGKSTAGIATADYKAKPVVAPLNPLNRKSLRVKADGAFSLENDGYYGMGVANGATYTLKLAARVADGFKSPLTAKLISADGKELATGELAGFTDKWAYYSVELTTSAADKKAKLVLSGEGKGTLFLDMVSVLPKQTWKNHGLRPDLAESIDALNPAFLRFPGGCWVEGETVDKMYQWKKTIGDIDARTPLWNIWGYYATHGLGYHEYLVMAEDLGAEPLFDINCGMSHHDESIPMSQMGQWVQDALDAIEYANGPTNSYWGGLRAKAGHPASFNLKYLEIGNENGGEAYRERWALMHQAIHAKYPEIQFIANHWKGSYPKEPRADIVDEHFYNTPEWFMAHADYFDKYDRVKSPKIFVGEYAVTRNGGKGNLRAAIGEAAFMTGLERNSDLVVMASYAPLFINLNHRAWPVNLINFDSTGWFGLPGYYVQKLFADNRGDVYLPTKVEAADIAEKTPTGGIGVGTWNTSAEYKDIKVTAPDGKVLFQSDFSQNADAWKKLGGGNWSVKDGALQQTVEKENVRALIGDSSWSDYTLELKARKLGGREGFMVLFHITGDDDRTWWNVGGWNNTQSGVELGGDTRDPKKVTIQTDRWYDLKVEVKGASVKCWLDGKLTHEVKDSLHTTRGIFASSARDNATGELILKVVNASHDATAVTLALNGANKLGSEAKGVILTSGNPKDENSIEEPKKVSPQPLTLKIASGVITHTFPGNSFTVLRVSAK